MGVMIYLNIMPNHMDEAEWEKVYEETLELINAYPFLDEVFDELSYGTNWTYVERTKEQPLEFAGNRLGWYTIGDELSLRVAESFVLIRDLQYYRKSSWERGNCDDILFSKIYSYPGINEQLGQLKVEQVKVFDAKTQGEPYHIPLLAIACLIESRFPRHAIVSGDISIGQMEKAVKWANTILKQPIGLTEQANNEKLLMRIKKELQEESAILEALMELTLREKGMDLGKLVREHFKPETIAAYFLARFKSRTLGTIGFSYEFMDYIHQGFSIEDACELCVLDPKGCNYDAKKFAKSVLSQDWPIGDTDRLNSISTEINPTDSAEPETVYSMLGKSFLKVAGYQEEMKSTLTFDKVAAILRDKLGHLCDIDALVNDITRREEKTSALVDEFYANLAGDVESEKTEKTVYTITRMEDLITWKSGDKIHPHVEAAIAKVKEFIKQLLEKDTDFFTEFQNMPEKDKMRQLIQSNRYFYIHKKVWDEILNNINDVQFTNHVLGLLSIVAEEITINKLCKSLLNNQELFKAYIS